MRDRCSASHAFASIGPGPLALRGTEAQRNQSVVFATGPPLAAVSCPDTEPDARSAQRSMQAPDNPYDPRITAVPEPDVAHLYPQIAGYTFLRKLGHGGMATVYLANQESLDRPVSIKVMDRDTLQDEISMQRFENEARTIARLSHPSIVGIYEVGRTADGRLYYSMPFLPNGDLAQRDLARDELRIVEVLRILLQALGYAHAHGIVHRDVKQENVLFDADNRPLLTDFGIALSKTNDVRITTAGLAVGSSGYMAPEQARGSIVDARADLYSVGVLAYELLTGALPFRSSDALAMALMHAQDPVPRLPPGRSHWQEFIDRAMAKSPDQRYASARQMLDALDRIGRRSGSQFSGRALRIMDRTIAGKGWKRPRLIALLFGLVLATALYAERGRLSSIGSARPAATKPTVVVPVPPQPAVLPAPASRVTTPATPPAGSPADDKQVVTHNAQSVHHARKKRVVASNAPARKPGLLKRIWRRIRHP